MADQYERSRALSREIDKQRKRLSRQIARAKKAGDTATVKALEEAKAATYQNRKTKAYEGLGIERKATHEGRTNRLAELVERKFAQKTFAAQPREKAARAELKGSKAAALIAATKQLWQGQVPITSNGRIDTSAIYQTVVENLNKVIAANPARMDELQQMGIEYPLTSTADVVEWLKEKTGIDYSADSPDYKDGIRYAHDPRSGMEAVSALIG